MSTSVLSFQFVRGYWITMRPYLLFVSGITGVTGLSFAPELSVIDTAILFVVFFFSYGFGQALTDCFQTDTDSISSPYRPIVKGEINKKDVFIVSLTLLTLCGLVLAVFSIYSLLLALFCVVGLATYTYFKRRWWGGPFYNGWIVAVLYLIGYNSGNVNSSLHLSAQIIFALITVLFGYANFVLVGYFKDVEADRSTGYNTFVVKWGRNEAAVLSDVFAFIFIISGILTIYLSSDLTSSSLIVPSIFMLASLSTSINTQIKVHQVKKDEEAHKAVSFSVHTYILMLCAAASVNKPEWIIFLILFYFGFIMTLSTRPEKTQI